MFELITNMEGFLRHILIDPNTGEKLTVQGQQLLNEKRQYTYPIVDGIPVLLPNQISNHVEIDSLHQDFGSSFDYIDHYQQDAIVFDYFKPFSSGATRHEERRLHEAIQQRVTINQGIILDVGCGKGWVADHYTANNWQVISMDISLTNPQKVAEKYKSNHQSLVADAFHLPIQPNTIDVIIAAEIMEHVQDPKVFMERLVIALKPGGQLLITTPYNEDIAYHLCVHCNRPTPAHAHLHRFNEQNIKPLLPAGTHTGIKIFSNKYLTKARTHYLLQFFPYSIWNEVDKMANWIFPKATRLLLDIRKPIT